MNLHGQTKNAMRENILFVQYDAAELKATRSIAEKAAKAKERVIAQKAANKKKLKETRSHRAEKLKVMESLEVQLARSRKETDDMNRETEFLEQRLTETSADIVAKREQCRSLEAECQALIAARDEGEEKDTKAIERKRCDLAMYRQMTGIVFDCDAAPHEVRGYVKKKNDIVTFDMSTNEVSSFLIANKLWEMSRKDNDDDHF